MSKLLLPLLSGLAIVLAKWVTELTANGASLGLNGINYFIPPFAVDSISVDWPGASTPTALGFVPVTIVQEVVDDASLHELFVNWSSTDDVFQSGFTRFQILAQVETLNFSKAEADKPGSRILPLDFPSVPSGPYFLEVATGAIHEAYRLYDDFSGAFTESLIQAPDGTFHTLSARIASSATVTIGVPSRLYHTKTAEKPLAGVRIGVQDIYWVAGVKNSFGNRAYYNLYPASDTSAPAVQHLIDAGAQIVGLQKTSQFASGERATAEWVDYHSPFNPRGDGYQDSSSSSAGAGSSIASYEWLDLALGIDTGGSLRDPAGVSGSFGNRPSHGLAPLDQVMPLSTLLDTSGFVTRDPYLWDDAQKVLYGDGYSSFVGTEPIKYPTQIYTMEFHDAFSSDGDAVLDDFALKLAQFVGGTVTPLDLDAMWNESIPLEAKGQGVMDFMNITYPVLIGKDHAQEIRDAFYTDYACKSTRPHAISRRCSYP